jgi:hypothetical protein
MKTCTADCKRRLPLEDFPVDRSRKDGRGSQCRKCKNKRRCTSNDEYVKFKEIVAEFNAPRIEALTARIRRDEQIISKVASPDKMQAWEALELLKGKR